MYTYIYMYMYILIYVHTHGALSLIEISHARLHECFLFIRRKCNCQTSR